MSNDRAPFLPVSDSVSNLVNSGLHAADKISTTSRMLSFVPCEFSPIRRAEPRQLLPWSDRSESVCCGHCFQSLRWPYGRRIFADAVHNIRFCLLRYAGRTVQHTGNSSSEGSPIVRGLFPAYFSLRMSVRWKTALVPVIPIMLFWVAIVA